MSIATIAQNLARNTGWPVFPVRENKAPATPHGFKDAETDPERVAALWQLYPAPLIGVPTGERSGLDVLDIDVKHSAARAWLQIAQAKMPATRIYQTRSGGFHIYFRHAPGVHNTESHIAKGIDTRGEGGYIIFWFGSGLPCMDHSPVAEWPDWLLEALFYKPESESLPVHVRQPFRDDGSAAQRLIARTLERVVSAADGQRQAALRAGAVTIGGALEAAGLSRTTASRMLLDAVLQAGGARVDQRNALGTIGWGLHKGAASPLILGGR